MFILLVGVKCLSYNASNGVNYQKSETAPIFLKRLFLLWGHVCTGSTEIGTNWLWKYKNQNKHTYLCEMHAAHSTCLTAHFTQVLIFALSAVQLSLWITNRESLGHKPTPRVVYASGQLKVKLCIWQRLSLERIGADPSENKNAQFAQNAPEPGRNKCIWIAHISFLGW